MLTHKSRNLTKGLSTLMSDTKKIKSKECRFVTYVRPPEYGMPDLHLVKEIVHYEDGTSSPEVKLLYDYQRPFWVTKKSARNYKQPKEWIDKALVQEYYAPQHRLIDAASRALGRPGFQGSQRMLQQNPYLFGTDIKSTAVIKKAYQDRYKDAPNTLYSSCMLDVETDVIHGTEEILMLTIYYKNLCITGVTKNYIAGIHGVQEKVHFLMRKYLGEYVEKYHIEDSLIEYDTEFDLLKGMFEKIHELRPDNVAIWNLDFEIGKFIAACQRVNADPADIFSDPSVPKPYRYFDYKRGAPQKVTASGKITPIPPAARWHTVHSPSSFYFIDAMCAFKHTRIGKPERASYSLDSILAEELKLGKLKFSEADGYERLKWHIFMQTNYKLEYIIYNRFDCIGMQLLEDKNKDLGLFVPLYSGTSDFEDFKSQPRRTVDQLHWYVMEHGKVMGTTSSALVDEYTKHTVPMENWISNLAASLITPQGMKIIEEDPSLETTIYTNVGDLDVSASYPNGEVCFNISKETTSKEFLGIEGVEDEVSYKQNMLLCTGHVDAVEWCTNMLGFPKLTDLLSHYDKNNANQ